MIHIAGFVIKVSGIHPGSVAGEPKECKFAVESEYNIEHIHNIGE